MSCMKLGKMSQSGCPLCCHPCIRCCCPHLLTDKHPGVQYHSPEKASAALESQQFNPVPLDKSFVFHQPKAEYSVLPQDSDTEDQSSVISEQPKPSHVGIQSPSSVESGSLSTSTPCSPDTLPTLEFSLYYDIQKNTLTVHLHQAFNLPSKPKSGGCNSCVVLYLMPNKLEVFESQVVRKNTNPEYNQLFHFSNLSGPDLLHKQTLVFRILEYNRFSSRDLVGMVTIDLADADLYGISTKLEIQRIPVTHRTVDDCGDVLLSLTYQPDQNIVQGIVLRVANLHGSELTGTRDPYVKVCLYHNGMRQYKWKSSIKKQTVNPVYNERFHFDILNMNLERVTLEIIVMDYDRFSRDAVIGMLCIGSEVSEDMCKTYWEEVVGSPNHAVSRWHKMSPAPRLRPRTHTL